MNPQIYFNEVNERQGVFTRRAFLMAGVTGAGVIALGGRLAALQLVEAEVARAEARVAELEQKLAQDWADMALLSAHRAAREDLEALLKRWESLFESSQTPVS